MKKKYLHPEQLVDATVNCHTHVISVRGGRSVYVSGQTALDMEGNVVGHDLPSQAAKAWDNLIHALDTADAEPVDIVSLTIHVKGLTPEHVAILNETIFGHFRKNKFPTRSIVGVQSLGRDELLVEMSAVAVIE